MCSLLRLPLILYVGVPLNPKIKGGKSLSGKVCDAAYKNANSNECFPLHRNRTFPFFCLEWLRQKINSIINFVPEQTLFSFLDPTMMITIFPELHSFFIFFLLHVNQLSINYNFSLTTRSKQEAAFVSFLDYEIVIILSAIRSFIHSPDERALKYFCILSDFSFECW